MSEGELQARADLGIALLKVDRLQAENLRLERELRDRNEDLQGFRLAREKAYQAVAKGDGPARLFLPTIVVLEPGAPQSQPTPYGLVAVPLENCPICQALMAPPGGAYASPFERRHETSYEAQVSRARWEIVANVRTLGGKKICRACAKADKGLFRCDLCEKERPTSQVKERYGDPEYREEYLCTPCFETVTAKVWNEKCDELRESHRYDYD